MSSSSSGKPPPREGRSSDDKDKNATTTTSSSPSPTPSAPVHLSALGLGREEENLLTVWYLRVRDSLSQHPIVHDGFTEALMDKLDVDLTRSQFRLDATYVQYAASRTKQIDDWTTDFLDRHQFEDALVLQLRCGLDNRYLRVNRGNDVKWIDVERPNVVRLRERLLPRPRGDYSLVAGDVGTDDDAAWLRAIPADRPTMIIMESLLYYLEPGNGLLLFERLLAHFRHGNIVMDTLGSIAVTFGALVPPTRTRFKWGIDDAEDLVKIDDRLVLRERIYTQESFGKDHPPWFGGWTPIISLLPKVSLSLAKPAEPICEHFADM